MATARALLIRIWCTLLFRATSRRDPDGRQFVRKPTGTCPAAGTKRAGPSGSLNATDQPQGLLRVSIRHLGGTPRPAMARALWDTYPSADRRFGACQGWLLRPFGGAFWTAGPGDLCQPEMAAAT